ncbi:imm11 family protein [Paenibacillus sp. PL91]|uniref:imm11 family protein n=1 Tax=Paenibacillus sp. PL91 TaxID=2729538 RepID=UPI00145FB42C|nr:DUF1629 domain-containing protein [Paenibacillus sp. PL91]MBC9204656.1 hypothetical protein [Paenibacillus sp. PL91]
MKIWMMLAGSNNMVVDPVDYDSFDYVNGFNGKPISDWKAAQFKVIKKGKSQDFVYLHGGIPIFNGNSLKALNGLMSDYVDLLDLEVTNHNIELKMINVVNLIDAVDYSRSIPERQLRGKVKGFKKLNFIDEKVEMQTIFKIPEFPYTRVYVSDKFRDVVLASNLKGFEFIEAWDSEQTDEIEKVEQQRYEAFLAEIEKNKGTESNWSDAVDMIEQGTAVASGPWKIQNDKNGIMQIARLSLDCKYSWIKSDIVTPILLGLKWHEVEKLDM